MGHENFNIMRKAMVESQLRTSNVSDMRVIEAMSAVPREDFVSAAQRNVAYADRGVRIGDSRALNAPLTTGRLLDAARLKLTDNVLLIGAASGYTAAVLARLAGQVTAVEQSSTLAAVAVKNLAGFENVTVEKSSHTDGFAAGAPYSVIMIDGIVDQVPQILVDQLAGDGRLVAAIIDNGVARCALGHKAGDSIGYQFFADCGGCHLPGFERAKGFVF